MSFVTGTHREGPYRPVDRGRHPAHHVAAVNAAAQERPKRNVAAKAASDGCHQDGIGLFDDVGQ